MSEHDRAAKCEHAQDGGKCDQFYNTRFENDNLIWFFKYVGYFAFIDFCVNVVNNTVIWLEYEYMLKNDTVSNPCPEQIALTEGISLSKQHKVIATNTDTVITKEASTDTDSICDQFSHGATNKHMINVISDQIDATPDDSSLIMACNTDSVITKEASTDTDSICDRFSHGATNRHMINGTLEQIDATPDDSSLITACNTDSVITKEASTNTDSICNQCNHGAISRLIINDTTQHVDATPAVSTQIMATNTDSVNKEDTSMNTDSICDQSTHGAINKQAITNHDLTNTDSVGQQDTQRAVIKQSIKVSPQHIDTNLDNSIPFNGFVSVGTTTDLCSLPMPTANKFESTITMISTCEACQLKAHKASKRRTV